MGHVKYVVYFWKIDVFRNLSDYHNSIKYINLYCYYFRIYSGLFCRDFCQALLKFFACFIHFCMLFLYKYFLKITLGLDLYFQHSLSHDLFHYEIIWLVGCELRWILRVRPNFFETIWLQIVLNVLMYSVS